MARRRRSGFPKIPPMAYAAAALAFYYFVLRPRPLTAALPRPAPSAPALPPPPPAGYAADVYL